MLNEREAESDTNLADIMIPESAMILSVPQGWLVAVMDNSLSYYLMFCLHFSRPIDKGDDVAAGLSEDVCFCYSICSESSTLEHVDWYLFQIFL